MIKTLKDKKILITKIVVSIIFLFVLILIIASVKGNSVKLENIGIKIKIEEVSKAPENIEGLKENTIFLKFKVEDYGLLGRYDVTNSKNHMAIFDEKGRGCAIVSLPVKFNENLYVDISAVGEAEIINYLVCPKDSISKKIFIGFQDIDEYGNYYYVEKEEYKVKSMSRKLKEVVKEYVEYELSRPKPASISGTQIV